MRVDYSKNVNQIFMIMNKLYDDSNMTLLKLNKINALLDKSLDYAWKLCCVKKRKKHKIINDEDKNMYLDRYTNIVNDKLDLVNQIGELVDSYVSDAYNIVDGIHTNSSLYYILEEDLKKCKDNFNILMYIINQILKRKIVNQILLMINQILKRKIVKRKILKRKIVKQILKRKTVKRKIMPILVRKKIM